MIATLPKYNQLFRSFLEVNLYHLSVKFSPFTFVSSVGASGIFPSASTLLYRLIEALIARCQFILLLPCIRLGPLTNTATLLESSFRFLEASPRSSFQFVQEWHSDHIGLSTYPLFYIPIYHGSSRG